MLITVRVKTEAKNEMVRKISDDRFEISVRVNNSVPAIDPAGTKRPVMKKLITKVSSDAVIRQVTAFANDRR